MFPQCQIPFQFAIWDATQWLNVRGRQEMPTVITAQTQSENGWVFQFTGVWKYQIFCTHWQKAVCSLSIVFVTTISNESTSMGTKRTDTWMLYIFINACRNICIQQREWECIHMPTRHMDHPAVAVLHQVSCLTVDPAGRDAVSAEEVWVHRRGLAVPPWRR